MTSVNIGDRVRELEIVHAGLRPLSRAIGVDVSYLKRLRDGEKDNPSDEILDKIGLEKRVSYVLK